MSVHVITGVGADGRSCVISIKEKSDLSAAGFAALTDDSSIHSDERATQMAIAKLYEAERPGLVPRAARGHLLPIATPPHGALWLEMKFDGRYETEFHRTDSVDFHYVVSGEVDLILEEGSITLRAGDTAVLPGVVHRWQSDASWHSALFVIGLEPA